MILNHGASVTLVRVKIEKWANVLFVVAKGLGARFVSKKIMNERTSAAEGSRPQARDFKSRERTTGSAASQARSAPKNVSSNDTFEVIFRFPKNEIYVYKIPRKPGLYKIPHTTIRAYDCSYVNHDGKKFVWTYTIAKPGDYELDKFRAKPIVDGKLIVR